jgi:hypothetical protein
VPIRPTVEAITEAATDLKSFYAERNRLMRQNESLYWLEYVFPNPNDIEPVIPPTAKTIIQDMQDRVASEFPVIRQPPRAEHQKAKDQAERVTMGLDAMWQRAPIGMQPDDVGLPTLIRDMIFDGGIKGKYVVQFMYREEMRSSEPITPLKPSADLETFAEEMGEPGDVTPAMAMDFISAHAQYAQEKASWEEKHEDWEGDVHDRIPFRFQPVMPEYCFESPDGSFVLKIYRRTIGDITHYFPDARVRLMSNGGLRRDTDTVEWIECWTDGWYMFIADGQVVKSKTEHHYGFLPFVINGPYKNPNRHTGERTRVHKSYESIYSGLTSIMRSEVAMETLAQAILENYAWPTKVLKSDGHDQIDVQTGPDAVTHIGRDDDMALLASQAPPAALIQMLDRHKQRAQDAVGMTGSRNVSGGRESGYSRAIQAQFARLKDQPIELALSTSISSLSSMALMATVNKVKTKIHLLGEYRGADISAVLDPKDIGNHFRVNTKLTSVQPMDEAQRINTGVNLYQVGAISLETLATDYGGRKDFQREMKRVIRERVIMSETVQAALEELFIKGYGLPKPAEEAYEVALAATKMGQTSDVPLADPNSQSAPGAPGTAIPGSPLELGQQTRAARKATPPQPEGAPAMNTRSPRGSRGGKRRSNRGSGAGRPMPVPYRS